MLEISLRWTWNAEHREASSLVLPILLRVVERLRIELFRTTFSLEPISQPPIYSVKMLKSKYGTSPGSI